MRSSAEKSFAAATGNLNDVSPTVKLARFKGDQKLKEKYILKVYFLGYFFVFYTHFNNSAYVVLYVHTYIITEKSEPQRKKKKNEKSQWKLDF